MLMLFVIFNSDCIGPDGDVVVKRESGELCILRGNLHIESSGVLDW